MEKKPEQYDVFDNVGNEHAISAIEFSLAQLLVPLPPRFAAFDFLKAFEIKKGFETDLKIKIPVAETAHYISTEISLLEAKKSRFSSFDELIASFGEKYKKTGMLYKRIRAHHTAAEAAKINKAAHEIKKAREARYFEIQKSATLEQKVGPLLRFYTGKFIQKEEKEYIRMILNESADILMSLISQTGRDPKAGPAIKIDGQPSVQSAAQDFIRSLSNQK
ncbi:MAG: hypothetical protein LBU87_07260 [Lactobacillales bacterium]|jgi:hypothetical protein|nr:hypothetical protein [Lactobacillales bacterium]